MSYIIIIGMLFKLSDTHTIFIGHDRRFFFFDTTKDGSHLCEILYIQVQGMEFNKFRNVSYKQ